MFAFFLSGIPLLLASVSFDAAVVRDDAFSMLNIMPSAPGREEVLAKDAVEFTERTGNPYCLYSLTLHPQGKPAMKTVDAAVESYRRWAKLLEGSKVRPGILLQAIIGHWTQDLAEKDTESWQRQININGEVTRYCPLDSGYQDYIREVGRKLAACRPSVILGDDDIRAFSPHAECFCPLHTAEFNRRTGKGLSPEAFRQLVKGASVDSPDHRAFAELQRDSVATVCRLLREGMDAVDPSIPAGVCEPGWTWAMRYMPDYAKAIAAKGQTPFLRLGNGNYYERSPKEEIGGVTLRTLAETERLKGLGLLPLDEADTWPQNLWSKSAVAFHGKLVVGAFAGLKGAKLWLVNAHKGDGPVTRHYTDILAEHRGFYGALSAAVRGSVPTGVLVPCHPEFPSQPVSAMYGANSYDECWAQKVFSWFGIPFVATFDFERDGVYAVCGEEAAKRFSDDQIRKMLSRRAIVDGLAAVELLKRGFGDLLGVSLRTDKPLFTSDYNEMRGEIMSYPKRTNPPLFAAADGVEVLSSMIWRESPYVKEFERVSPSTVLFRNPLGGIVVTTAYNPWIHSAYVYTEARQKFIRDILDRANGAPFENACANAQNVLALSRRAIDGADLILVQNLNFDSEDGVLVRRATCPPVVEEMSKNGEWLPVEFAYADGLVSVPGRWGCYETRILRFCK